MELAKLFATVGFKVDREGLTEFRKEMMQLRGTLKDAAAHTGSFRRNLVGLNAQLKAFGRNIDPSQLTRFSKRLTTALGEFITLYQQNADMQKNTSKWADAFINNLVRLHSAIEGRNRQIKSYSDAIADLAQSFYHLKQATQGISRFRQVPASATTGGGGRSDRMGGGGGESNQYVGYWGRASGIAKNPAAAFLRPMLPTGMGLFNAVAAGYGFKELVNTGREMMQLENMLKAVSGSQAEFNKNLEFTKKTADELGISIQNITEGYAKMYLAAKPNYDTDTIQRAFKGAQTYFRLLGMSAEKINLSNKAIQQMFNKERVTAEELRGQLGEHAAGVIKFFADAAANGSVKELFKMMEEGRVSADATVKAMQLMGEWAAASPELRKQLEMSAAAQGRFNNRMAEFSKVMMESGLDELLTELFGLLTKFIKVLTPVVKTIIWVIKGLKEFVKVVWDFKEAIGGLSILGYVAADLGFLGIAATGAAFSFGILAANFWAAHGALIKLTATFTAFLYVFKSIDNYLNGEDNWLHGVQLGLEWLMTAVDVVGLRFQLMFEMLKYGWLTVANEITDNPLWKYNPLVLSAKALGTGAAALQEWVNKQEGATTLHDNPYSKPIPQNLQRPSMAPQSIVVQMTIDATKIKGGTEGDWQMFGQGVGQAIKERVPFSANGLLVPKM